MSITTVLALWEMICIPSPYARIKIHKLVYRSTYKLSVIVLIMIVWVLIADG